MMNNRCVFYVKYNATIHKILFINILINNLIKIIQLKVFTYEHHLVKNEHKKACPHSDRQRFVKKDGID